MIFLKTQHFTHKKERNTLRKLNPFPINTDKQDCTVQRQVTQKYL